MTAVQIIDETVEYYRNNPRARTVCNGEVFCHYYDDGKMCAVGRCLVDPEKYTDSGLTAHDIINCDGDEIFQKKYRGHSIVFWNNLQELHDDVWNLYWVDNELTPSGIVYVERMKEKFV